MKKYKILVSPVASSETTALQAAAYPTIPYPGVGRLHTLPYLPTVLPRRRYIAYLNLPTYCLTPE